MKPLCLDGDLPQFAVRRDGGEEPGGDIAVWRAFTGGVLLGLAGWALILLGLAWLAGWPP